MPKRTRRGRKRVRPVSRVEMADSDAICPPKKKTVPSGEEETSNELEDVPSLRQEPGETEDSELLRENAEGDRQDGDIEKHSVPDEEHKQEPGASTDSGSVGGTLLPEVEKNSNLPVDSGGPLAPESGATESSEKLAGSSSPQVSGGQGAPEKVEGQEEGEQPEIHSRDNLQANRKLEEQPSTVKDNASIGITDVVVPGSKNQAMESRESLASGSGSVEGGVQAYGGGSLVGCGGADLGNQPQESDTADTENASENTNGGDTGGSKTSSVESEEQPHASSPTFTSSSQDESDEENWGRPWLRDSPSQTRPKIQLPKMTRYSSFDTEQYRNGYPDKADNPRLNKNLEFYMNKRRCSPDGCLIDEIHERWWGDYAHLEYCHTFIQWLFPIRERGMNYYAQELQPHEITAICEDKQAKNRLLKSYEMMLDFYGMRLTNEETGEIKRNEHWKERFCNLNRSFHNYLRITRILKCLGEFGLEKYKVPFVRFCLREAIEKRTLANTLHSALTYWTEVVRDDQERRELWEYAQQLADSENEKPKLPNVPR